MIDDRDRGERRGERQVVACRSWRRSRLPSSWLVPPTMLHRDVVAEAEREREDRAGDDRREDQRQHHRAERAPAPARRGRPTPRAASPAAARARRRSAGSCTAATGRRARSTVAVRLKPGRPGRTRQHRVTDAVRVEHRPPGVRLDQVARPQRHEHGDDEHGAPTRRATLAMENAIGNAMSDVDDRHRERATPTVRRVDRAVDGVGEDVAGSSSSVNGPLTNAPVNESTVQNAATSSTASEPR